MNKSVLVVMLGGLLTACAAPTVAGQYEELTSADPATMGQPAPVPQAPTKQAPTQQPPTTQAPAQQTQTQQTQTQQTQTQQTQTQQTQQTQTQQAQQAQTQQTQPADPPADPLVVTRELGGGPLSWSWNYLGNGYFPGGGNYYYYGFPPQNGGYFMVSSPSYCAPRFGSAYLWNTYDGLYANVTPYYSGYFNNNWYGVYSDPYGLGGYYSGLGFYPYSSYANPCTLSYYGIASPYSGYPYNY